MLARPVHRAHARGGRALHHRPQQRRLSQRRLADVRRAGPTTGIDRPLWPGPRPIELSPPVSASTLDDMTARHDIIWTANEPGGLVAVELVDTYRRSLRGRASP